MGNALMGALESFDAGDRRLEYFGEVFQDGLLDLLADGTFRRRQRHFSRTFGRGPRTTVRRHRTVRRRLSSPSGGRLEPRRTRSIGSASSRVNSALEVDIYGNANSTHVGGTQLIYGIGGSGDFNRNGLLSITALPSTAGDGDISRIVPAVTHVDHTEHDVSVIVTEHGVADLRGLSPVERAKELIAECASPDYREPLRTYFDRARERRGHTPHDFGAAYDWLD